MLPQPPGRHGLGTRPWQGTGGFLPHMGPGVRESLLPLDLERVSLLPTWEQPQLDPAEAAPELRAAGAAGEEGQE